MIVDAPSLGSPIAPDPADDKFLACALAADVRIIVTGDKPLRSVSGWADLEILTPRHFADRYLGESVTEP
jgi:predicted nucleic acid-binding protein